MQMQLEENLFETISAKYEGLEGLFDLLNKDLSFEDLISNIVKLSQKVIPSEAGSILELDYKQKNLFFRAAEGTVADKLKMFRVPLGVGIAGFVAESGQVLNLGNVAENKIHLKSLSDSVGFEVRNIICVPILIRDKIYGVLELLNRIGDTRYTESDQDVLVNFCQYVGKLIEYKLVLHNLQKRIRESG